LQQSQTFTASGPGTPVNWSVNGVAGGNATVGTIDVNGVYTAPVFFPGIQHNVVTVTATSKANAGQSGTAAATVVYPNDTAGAQPLPIKFGTQGGNANDTSITPPPLSCCVGTLGSLWTRSGTLFVLSNNHVLARSGLAQIGEAINQPGSNSCFSAPNLVASLAVASAIQPTATSNGIAESNVDAAIAQVAPGAVDTTGSILDLGQFGQTSIAPAPPSSTLAVAVVGQGVAKTGRTSGLTCSTISSINTDVSVSFDSFCTGPQSFSSIFVSQVVISGPGFSSPGDAGSLIVTSDNARPVALLFAGNGGNTLANPIQDVITEFTINTRPQQVLSPVGGADHAVSCMPQAAAQSATVSTFGTAVPALSAQETRRAERVRQEHAMLLMRDPAITFVGLSASEDSPGEGALEVHVSGTPQAPVPAVLDGVRTRVVFSAQTTAAVSVAELDVARAIAIKNAHAAAMMAQPGIQGIGVGVSKDAPGEPAITLFVVAGSEQGTLPATIDGVRTQIIAGERFRAY
jgi:hypothetical protein